MKIAIGGDHAGYAYKETIKSHFEDAHTFEDFGPDSEVSMDYPDTTHVLAHAIEEKKAELGILICGSANGVAMTANKHQNIRAAVAWYPELAILGRSHNNANIICIPARFTSQQQAIDIVSAFLSTDFEGGRHERRVAKISC